MKQLKLQVFYLVMACFHIGAYSQENKEVTICWDVSLSMKDRDIDKEFHFLDDYFENVENADVTLLTFSDQVISKNDFTVVSGNWSTLKDKVKTLNYDGATSYDALETYTGDGEVILFTDGKRNSNRFIPSFEGKLNIVNSNKDFDRSSLNLLSIVNKADLSNLLDNEPYGADENNQKEQSEQDLISGTVYIDNDPAPNTLISVSGNENTYLTDGNGDFKIKAKVGDSILISNKVNKTYKTIPIQSKTAITVFLESNAYSLDEVVVVESRREENLVNTALGKQNKDKLGYDVQSIEDDEITEINTNISDAVAGRFAGVTQGGNDDVGGGSVAGQNNLSQVVIRGGNCVPLRQSNSGRGEYVDTSWINPSNVENITVLKGLAATNRYGSLGSAGVILITTKNASATKAKGKPVDQALLTNNVFEGKLISKKGQLNTPYLKELKKAKNLEEAYQNYLSQRESYKTDFWYFIDVSDYFRTANAELGDRVLSNLMELDFGYDAQKTLMLKYKALAQKEKALSMANKIAESFPNKIQSHYDLAIAHMDSGNMQAAADLLNGIVTGSLDATLNFSPLKKVAGAALRNLVNRHGSKLDLTKIDSSFKNNLTYNARLVFEWASPQDEFVLRFVNPQKRFFDWEHSSLADKNRITDELKNGFSIEQFELVGDISIGDWQVNATNLNTEVDSQPFLLKCKVQYNFGKPDQREEEQLIRLDKNDSKEQLFFKFKVE